MTMNLKFQVTISSNAFFILNSNENANGQGILDRVKKESCRKINPGNRCYFGW